jgi:hypothetical protein
MLELPTKVRPPITSSPTVLLLYGAPKVGKTSSIINLENNLVFDLESGGKLLSGLIIDVPQVARQESITRLNVLRRYYSLLKENGNGQYRFITFDTVDVLEDLLIEEVSVRHGVSHISDLAYGKGDAILREEFFALINAFKELDHRIILIGHRKRSIIGETGAEVVIRELDLRGKMRNMIMSYSDAIGYMFSTNGSLMLSFKTGQNEDIAAGSRCSYLANQEIELGKFNGNGEIAKMYWERIYPDLKQSTNSGKGKKKKESHTHEEKVN